MLGNRGFGFDTGWLLTNLFFFNLVFGYAEKLSKCREIGIDCFTKQTTTEKGHGEGKRTSCGLKLEKNLTEFYKFN